MDRMVIDQSMGYLRLTILFITSYLLFVCCVHDLRVFHRHLWTQDVDENAQFHHPMGHVLQFYFESPSEHGLDGRCYQ